MLFNKTFFLSGYDLIQLSNLLICFCSFDFSCRILENIFFIENVYIVLFCVIKECSLKKKINGYICISYFMFSIQKNTTLANEKHLHVYISSLVLYQCLCDCLLVL